MQQGELAKNILLYKIFWNIIKISFLKVCNISRDNTTCFRYCPLKKWVTNCFDLKEKANESLFYVSKNFERTLQVFESVFLFLTNLNYQMISDVHFQRFVHLSRKLLKWLISDFKTRNPNKHIL